jgi:hypothetical protein
MHHMCRMRMRAVASAGLLSQLCNQLPAGDEADKFKATLRNFVKGIQGVLGKYLDNTLVEIAAQVHELVSALLCSMADKAHGQGKDKLAEVLGTISPSLAQWGTAWTTMRDLENFMLLRLGVSMCVFTIVCRLVNLSFPSPTSVTSVQIEGTWSVSEYKHAPTLARTRSASMVTSRIDI